MRKYFPYFIVLHLLMLVFYNKVDAQQSRQTLLFNNNWKFYKGDIANDADKNFNDGAWKQLDLPHDWSIEGPFDKKWASGTAFLPTGIGWYRKTFVMAKEMQAKKIYLYFDGINNNSEVWINGHYLGKRPNGFIPFEYEITDFLNLTDRNTIAVKVDHTQFADSRWYTGSGINRNVYLIATNAVSIDQWGIDFSTPEVSLNKAMANVTVSLSNRSTSPCRVLVQSRLIAASGDIVAMSKQFLNMEKSGQGTVNLQLVVTHPALWSVEHPSLYTLKVTLSINGKSIDELLQEVGIRTFNFDKNKGFFLNGKSMKLKGVCLHDDAGVLGVAVPSEVWERRLKILKAGGCNAIRLSHNPHADYVYDLCDRLGFLVMDEAFDEWELGKNKWIDGWNVGKPGQDGYHEYFKEWADKDLGDMVLRDRNHPSIILWSIGNEIDYPNDPYTHPILNTGKNPQIYGKGYTPGYPEASRLTEIAQHLVALVKKYDTTRPVTSALAGVVMSNEVGFPEVLDVVGYNYQEFRYAEDHIKYPNRIMYGSENGMLAADWKAVADNDYISGQFLWTGIDYMGEARQWPARTSTAGLLDLAGFTKPAYYFRKSLWTKKPMTYISTVDISKDIPEEATRNKKNSIASWNYTVGDSTIVFCYTNCDAAELFLNGKSLGRKLVSNSTDRVISWKTSFQPGELLINGYINNNEVATSYLKTAGASYAIRTTTDGLQIPSGKKHVTHVEMNIVDTKGTLVYDAENEVTINIQGSAKLLGLESGNPISHEDYQSVKRKVFHGKLLAYIQSTGKPGKIKISITSPELKSQVIVLQVL